MEKDIKIFFRELRRGLHSLRATTSKVQSTQVLKRPKVAPREPD